MKYVKTFEEFVNENYELNESKSDEKYYGTGYHLIGIFDEDDMIKLKSKFKYKTIAVYGNLRYVVSLKKSTSLNVITKSRESVNNSTSPIAIIMYDADKGEFTNLKRNKVITNKKDLFHAYEYPNTSYADLENDIMVAKSGHVNDYEQIGAKIKKADRVIV